MYGPYTNEELLGRALAGRRNGIVIATKCGFVRDPADPGKREINNRPEYIRASCEGSLRRLGVEVSVHENRYHVIACIYRMPLPAALVRNFRWVCLLSFVPEVCGC